jgi:predicted ATPase/class 3 adenylate cyclase
MSTLPTGTVTFLCTDLESSTQIWEHQSDAMSVDLERHYALLHAAVAEHRGYVFALTGDGLYAAFQTALEAVQAALAAQQSLQDEPWAVRETSLKVRLVLHTGEPLERAGNYFGPVVNRAARLLGITHGGQTVLSRVTEQVVRDSLPAGVTLRDLGSHRLKDLMRPEQVFQLDHPELPSEFPLLRSLNEFPHNLPQRLDNFVGRERELERIKRLLGTSRLVTLKGPGGAGKTRLAQQAAAENLDQYPQGVWFVPLDNLADPALIPQALAAIVGVREQSGKTLTATLCEHLRTQQVLLILDNCEHLIDACAQFAQAVLQSCPGVRILATSREALEIGGESVYPVPTLLVGASQADAFAAPSDAVRLFVERAALRQPAFALTPQNAPVVERICRRLDGIPLVIELAAAWVRMLSVEEIAAQLQDSFRLLRGGSRTAVQRHRTVQTGLQWSYDLLTEPERLLFRRLSAFAGGWTLEAACRVCAGDDLDEYEVFDLLGRLVDKSLVQPNEEEDGERRYRLLQTLHEFSRELLLDSSETAARIAASHTDYFLALAEEAEAELRGPRQGEWLDRLETEYDNLRGALARSEGGTRLRLVASLHQFWRMRGYLTEGRKCLRETLDGGDAGADRLSLAKAINGAGVLAWAQRDNDAARMYYERARVLYGELNDEEGVARTLNNLGIVADYERDPTARRCYEESLVILRRLGDRGKIAYGLVNLGAHHIGKEDPDPQAALPLLEECLRIRRELGDQSGIAIVLLCLGRVASLQGQWPEARDKLCQCLTIRNRQGDKRGVMEALYHLAEVETALGNAAAAAPWLAAALALGETLHIPHAGVDPQDHDQFESSLRAALGDEKYEALCRHGASQPLDQVIADALKRPV